MTKTDAGTAEFSAPERLLVAIDSPPWDALYRIVIGFLALLVASRIWSESQLEWTLGPFLLGALLMLRLVPAVARRFVPASLAVRRIWADRRQLAKRYDSYQWRKLFWIGAGLTASTVLSGQFSAIRIVVCSVCLISGALGLAQWRVTAADLARRRAQ